MIIKLAGFGMGGALEAAGAASPIGVGTNIVIGSNIHDLGHFLFSKANRLGKATQRAAISDAIIAAKMAKDGKVWGNRTIPGLAMYNLMNQKALAMHETNQIVHAMPGFMKDNLLAFDKNNKLNVDRLKKTLNLADGANDAAFALQVAAPATFGVHDYVEAKRRGKSTNKAIRSGLSGAGKGAAISVGLMLPRAALSGSAGINQLLKKDKNYGYDLMEEAANSASISMNRPSLLNYSKHVYVTPEQNLKGGARHAADLVHKVMGFRKPISVHGPADYRYVDHKPTAIERIKSTVDAIPKAFGLNLA